MFDSFFHCRNLLFYSQIPVIMQQLIAFSSSAAHSTVAIEAHKCLCSLFSGINFVTTFDLEENHCLLAVCFKFLESELSSFVFMSSSLEFQHVFQPLGETCLSMKQSCENSIKLRRMNTFRNLEIPYNDRLSNV